MFGDAIENALAAYDIVKSAIGYDTISLIFERTQKLSIGGGT
jgi:hypothetical protein